MTFKLYRIFALLNKNTELNERALPLNIDKILAKGKRNSFKEVCYVISKIKQDIANTNNICIIEFSY